eukprot:6802408-Alexandrium_andersonii.AAC.1
MEAERRYEREFDRAREPDTPGPIIEALREAGDDPTAGAEAWGKGSGSTGKGGKGGGRQTGR